MIRYFLTLFEHFEPFSSTETSIDFLATKWQCSTRYSKTIIKKCQEMQWIQWETFKGRGKKPYIKLKLTKIQAIYIAFDEYWKNEHYDKAYKLLNDYKLMNYPEVNGWLIERFGFSQSEDALDIFRYPYTKVELNLDPMKGLSRHDWHMASQLFETLFDFCLITKEAKPNLVFAYDTDDYRIWRFTIRKNVLFHDGTKLTSKDVIASLKRAQEIILELFNIEEMIEISPYKVEIILEKANALFPRLLCSIKLAIVSHKWIEEGGGGVPIGCGPFEITTFSEQQMTLTVFPNYFKERPWIDVVEIIHTPEDVDFGISPYPLDKGTPHTKQIFYEEGADYILLNASLYSPLQNEQLRHTIYSLIQPIDYCLTEYDEQVANSFLLNGEEVITPLLEPIPANEFPKLKIGVQQIRANANHLREANILSKSLMEYGIEHELELVALNATADAIVKQYDIFVGGIAINENKIISLLSIYQSKNIPLKSFLNDRAKEQVNQLIRQIMSCLDEHKIINLFLKAEEVMQKTASLKFLTHRVHNIYIRSDSPFTGIEMDHTGKIDYSKIYCM